MIEEVKGANNSAPKPKTEQKNNDFDSVANSIFDKMDTDHDKFVSEQEAKDFGYTTLGDKSLSREDFLKKYRSFKEKTSTKQGILEDFKEHFSIPLKDSLRRFIQLDDAQQKEIVSRLEMFEATQKVMPEDKKYTPEDTAYIKENPKYFMNDDLAEYLEQFSANRTISDGKIGAFRQGKMGDCWFLSALNNYISTEAGRKNIENRIENNGNGTYSVTFQNPFNLTQKEVYTVSQDDLHEKYKDGATGDIDVRILEAAADQYLEKYTPEGQRNSTGEKMIVGDYFAKTALIHKAFGYKDNIKEFCMTESDQPGKKQLASFSYEIAKDENGKAKFIGRFEQTNLSSYKELVEQTGIKESELTFGSFHREQCSPDVINLDMSTEASLLSGGHIYNLDKINGNATTITNPHRSSFPMTIPNNIFNEFVRSLFYLPTNNIVQ